MAGVNLNPYLNFNGNAEEAANFYKNVFGAELEISRFSDFPGQGMPDDYKDKVMHATIKNEHMQLMVSDGQPTRKIEFGESVTCSLSGEDGETLKKYFEGLSQGGTVTMPLEKQMWGDEFGMVTDKFGIQWMIDVVAPKPAQ
jgi:PhnB protein